MSKEIEEKIADRLVARHMDWILRDDEPLELPSPAVIDAIKLGSFKTRGYYQIQWDK